VDGRAPRQVTFGGSDSLVADVSADGQRILCAASTDESDIWVVKVDTGEEFEITSDSGVELWPDISPDNKAIAYQGIKEPSQGAKLLNSNLFTKSIVGEAHQLQLTNDGFNPTWAPDGNHIAFLRVSGSTYNIWTVRASGGDEKQLTLAGKVAKRGQRRTAGRVAKGVKCTKKVVNKVECGPGERPCGEDCIPVNSVCLKDKKK
jgi:Tol biopolymer transport system component